VVAGVWAGAGRLAAVGATTTPVVDGGVADGGGVGTGAWVVVVGTVELADSCTGSI
jgi:hypothetical protein